MMDDKHSSKRWLILLAAGFVVVGITKFVFSHPYFNLWFNPKVIQELDDERQHQVLLNALRCRLLPRSLREKALDMLSSQEVTGLRLSNEELDALTNDFESEAMQKAIVWLLCTPYVEGKANPRLVALLQSPDSDKYDRFEAFMMFARTDPHSEKERMRVEDLWRGIPSQRERELIKMSVLKLRKYADGPWRPTTNLFVGEKYEDYVAGLTNASVSAEKL